MTNSNEQVLTPSDGMAPAKSGGKIKRLVPLAVIAAAIGLAVAFDLHTYFSFDALRDNRELLMRLVAEHALLTALGFIAIYAVATALSLPGGAILTLAGGFMFGTVVGTAYVVVAATLGATAIFLAAKTALGDSLRQRAGGWLTKMEAGFQENAFNYLLVLRLVPLFPFFVVNLVPAFLGVNARTYIAATFIGIIPGSFVFASVGAGLGSVFDTAEGFSPAAALTPEVIVALVGLSVLSLVPVVYKKIKARRATP